MAAVWRSRSSERHWTSSWGGRGRCCSTLRCELLGACILRLNGRGMGLVEASGSFGNFLKYARIRRSQRRDPIKQLWSDTLGALSNALPTGVQLSSSSTLLIQRRSSGTRLPAHHTARQSRHDVIRARALRNPVRPKSENLWGSESLPILPRL